ncbi:MAG: phosphoribosyltransferase [Chloroflexota bacterium]|nr:phosphoribosyltransferase [Chloroflexota bacterium]
MYSGQGAPEESDKSEAAEAALRARFISRTEAGQWLAEDLRRFLHGQSAAVIAIPPDGVPVAASVCVALGLPLEVATVGRILSPEGSGETLGGVTADRTLVVNGPLVASLKLSPEEVERMSLPVWSEAQRLEEQYRRGRPVMDLRGHTAIIINDGLTTGYTVMAAVLEVRKLQPSRVIVAVPVAAIEALERLAAYVDEVLSLHISSTEPFYVGNFYRDYKPVTDQEVLWTLDQLWSGTPRQGNSETF